jgi:hypothetical protein
VRADVESVSPKGVKRESKKMDYVDDLPNHPARIRVDGGLTKNLGDYESARLSVSLEIPCGTSDKEIRAAYLRTRNLVEWMLEEEYKQVIGED